MSSTPADDMLATEVGIKTYLRNTAFASHTINRLNGGYANFTYRIHLRVPVDGMSTFVLKYAPPYAAALADTIPMPFSPNRQVFVHSSRFYLKCHTHMGVEQRFEAEALRLANTIPRPDNDNTVMVPALQLFDEESHVMIIEDVGSDARTLTDILMDETLPGPLLEEIGVKLGRFLAHVHEWNNHPDVDLSLFENNEAGKMILELMIYGRLVPTLTGEDKIPYLLDPSLEIPDEMLVNVSKLAETRTKEIHSSAASGVMTHNDFWPGNIMVSLRRGADGAIEALDRLYVLDWELAMTGLPGLDLGQLCAELHIIARFHPHRAESAQTTLKSFLSAYRQNREISPAIARVTVGHIGAHLVAWTPRVTLSSRERTREAVLEGVELLDLGWTGSESSLLDSIVGPLFQTG